MRSSQSFRRGRQSVGKQSRALRQRMIQSISHAGTQTQNRPHSSVTVVASTSRLHLNGRNHDQCGQPGGL